MSNAEPNQASTASAIGGAAFGAPGIEPRWAAADKDLVVTALGVSRVWATVGGGVLNEIYWPHTGEPQIRDIGFIVTGNGFWSEVKREANYTVVADETSRAIHRIVHTHPKYVLTLEVICDSRRDVVLINYELTVPSNSNDHGGDLKVHLLAAPHLDGTGHSNDGWTEDGALFASNGACNLAIMADGGFDKTSVGFVGSSDGWQDISAHGKMTWQFDTAIDGNIALTGALSDLSGTIAAAFSTTPSGAKVLARSSLAEGYRRAKAHFAESWDEWLGNLRLGSLGNPEERYLDDLAITSAMVLRTHEDSTYAGAMVASLSTPWGFAHNDPGGYHLVWPRDCSESGLALIAAGLFDDARRLAYFLSGTQLPGGNWSQNFSPDGTAYWHGVQMDEAALPIILTSKLAELGHLTIEDQTNHSRRAMLAEMCLNAGHFIAANGPTTDQDRWEESPGYNPFTSAAVVAALAGAALTGMLSGDDATYALSLADWWNATIEDHLYVTGTELDTKYGTAGHYIRVAPRPPGSKYDTVRIANRDNVFVGSGELVGLEFLALTRYGLRQVDDPRIVDTVKIVDNELGQSIDEHTYYHRYQHDGYGEHDDGWAFDGTGLGRLWPLLAGERGHYAQQLSSLTGAAVHHSERDHGGLAALKALASSSSAGGLLPEQIWNAEALPAHRLYPGRPTGSAMPLVWAHAEYLKLFTAVTQDFWADRINAVANRYSRMPTNLTAHLRDGADFDLATMPGVENIVIESSASFVLHYSTDDWATTIDRESTTLGLGMFGVEFNLGQIKAEGVTTLVWTRLFTASDRWEGSDHRIEL